MKTDSVKTLDAIRQLALQDLDATSDEELRAETINDGAEPEAVARSVAAELDAFIAATLRDRAAIAKARTVSLPAAATRRPSLARIRELIDNTFRADPCLATAFREGTRQSEADLQSLYDDLVALGKIEPEGND